MLSTAASLAQQADLFQTYVIVNTNGGGNDYRAGGKNADNASLFDGSTYGAATSSIYLNGGEIKTFKNNGGDVTGAYLNYRVYRVGTTPGNFTELNLPFKENLANSGDQKWAIDNADVNLANEQPSGDYTLEVYWRITTNQCDRFDSNNGANYKASFTVTPTTLPVSLDTFNAKTAGSLISLDWVTAAETDNAQFAVERSADAVAFTSLGIVTGKGTTTMRHAYQFIDEAPLAGINYYRLKQIDLDGRFSYSPTRAAILRTNGELTLLGNPVATDLTVTGLLPGSATELRDVAGQLRFQQTATDNRMQVDVRQLPAGTYLLRVVEPTGVQVKRVLVTR